MNPILLILWLFAVLIATVAALLHNASHSRRFPNSASYRYGYFLGYFLLLWPFCLAVSRMGVAGANLGDVLGILLFSLVFFSIAGFFILRRSQLAFIIGSVLSFNPLFWILSLICGFRHGPRVWPSKATPPPLPKKEEKEYFVHDTASQHGPFSLSVIKQKVADGSIGADWLYWREDANEWKPVREIK